MMSNSQPDLIINFLSFSRPYQLVGINVGILLGAMTYILLSLALATLFPRKTSQLLTSTPLILPLLPVLAVFLHHLAAEGMGCDGCLMCSCLY